MQQPNKCRNLAHQRFGNLTAVRLATPDEIEKAGPFYGKSAIWMCICDCGNPVYASSRRLVDGSKRNCGCRPKDNLKQPHKPVPTITVNGKRQSISAWSKQTGIPYNTLYKRIFICGWNPKKAVTEPIRDYGKQHLPPAYSLLALAILRQAANDYRELRTGTGPQILTPDVECSTHELESFFNGEYCAGILAFLKSGKSGQDFLRLLRSESKQTAMDRLEENWRGN